MRAAYIEETGPPEVIKIGELPQPEPGPGQVLVKVKAAALNPIDLYLRSGLVPMPLAFPYVIGCDLAGTVAKLGQGATRFAVGDRVWGSNQGLLGRPGTASEFAAVDQEWLYPIPESLTDNEAAAMALVGITSHLGAVPVRPAQEWRVGLHSRRKRRHRLDRRADGQSRRGQGRHVCGQPRAG